MGTFTFSVGPLSDPYPLTFESSMYTTDGSTSEDKGDGSSKSDGGIRRGDDKESVGVGVRSLEEGRKS